MHPIRNTAHDARTNRTRRGSTIVFAVGVLAVLALIAVTYTTIVRLDRSAASAYANRVDYNQQVYGVVNEVQALLTADLFGNKIVTSEVPRRTTENPLDTTSVRIWPRAFEDGEHYDYPSVDTDPDTMTFHDPVVGEIDNPNAPWSLTLNQTFSPSTPFFSASTRRDDAWLSATEPADNVAGDQRPDTWPQITNLRSAYRWRAPEPGVDLRNGYWTRDDGRFVDLAQWFLQEDAQAPGRGNPNADLFEFEYTGVANQGLAPVENSPALAVGQEVFDFQIHQLDLTADGETLNDPVLEGVDERYWVDADGDLRPDSRWTQLDVLGDLYGLKWVVAARIIDNSSMVNVNSSLELADSDPQYVGDARTPADIDLYRLILNAAQRDNWLAPNDWVTDPELSTITLNNFTTVGFDEHIRLGLGLDRVIDRELIEQQTLPVEQQRYPGLLAYPATPNNPLTRAQRRLVWDQFGAAPLDRRTAAATPYPVSDETDLRAYHGVNFDSLVAKFEQRFDSLNLPGQADLTGQNRLGPMRAGETEGVSRVLVSALEEARPSVEQLRDDTRRLLTTVSGVSDLSPIPAVNPGFNLRGLRAFSGEPQRKIRLEDLYPGRNGATSGLSALELELRLDRLDDVFASFMWALAPLSTSTPLYPTFESSSIVDLYNYAADHNAHYGGGDAGPARVWRDTITTVTGTTGAAYATHRALALTANLADATDDDGEFETPTLLRFYNDPYTEERARLSDNTVYPYRGVGILGTRFAHGDVPLQNNSAALPPEFVGGIGDPDPDGSGLPPGGVTIAGLDAQPFLLEAVTVSAYHRQIGTSGLQSGGPVQGITSELIVPSDENDQLGSIFAIELGNPFDTDIRLNDYRVRLAADAGVAAGPAYLEFLLGLSGSIDTMRSTLSDAIVPAGQRVMLVFHRHNPDPSNGPRDAWFGVGATPGFLDEWLTAVTDASDISEIIVYEAVQDLSDPMNQHVLSEENIVPAGEQLDGVMFQHMVAGQDYSLQLIHAIPTTSVEYEEMQANPTPILVDRLRSTSAGTQFPAVARADILVNDSSATQDSGYAVVSSNILRPTNQHSSTEGFPAWVLENPTRNQSFTSGEQIETWPEFAGADPYINVMGSITGVESNQLGVQDKSDPLADIPSFQLFVPNSRLYSTTELAMLSPFAHVYVHPATSAGNLPPDINAASESFPTLPDEYAIPREGRWVTVSEQLGANHHLAYNTQGVFDATNANPYLGALDLSRYILSASGGGDLGVSLALPIPDQLSVPLATRVFDCFEANLLADSRASGRVNVNTAPERVLRVLPYVDPTPGGQVEQHAGVGATLQRHKRIMSYRDARDFVNQPSPPLTLDSTSFMMNRAGLTNRATLRASDQAYPPPNRSAAAFAPNPGVASLGELAILGRWSGDVTAPDAHVIPAADEPATGFLYAAHNGTGNLPLNTVLDLREGVSGFDGVNDAEERLAIFRGLSSTASTRSDVYTAWFVLRGYDPSQIEAQTTDGLDDEAKTRLLNNLQPAYSARWLAVLDRSNVSSPRDRPRILLLVEIPEN